MKFLVGFFFILGAIRIHAQAVRIQTNLIQTPVIVEENHHWSGWQKFYKTYISSQDGDVCNFYPSCSSFAKESISKHVWIIGIFLASDRLIRCNGRPGDYFEIENGKNLDLP